MAKLILSPAPCTVRKAAGRAGYIVEGEIAVIAGKVVREPFRRLFSTKRAAEHEAEIQDSRNEEAVAELEAETAAEKTRVAAARAARDAAKAEKASRQFAFQF